jgi:hypothetical protein
MGMTMAVVGCQVLASQARVAEVAVLMELVGEEKVLQIILVEAVMVGFLDLGPRTWHFREWRWLSWAWASWS